MNEGSYRILILADYYLPGYKGGGPVRTLSTVVHQLGDEFDFKVVTLDRDLGDTEPYPELTAGSLQRLDKLEVLYISPRSITLRSLRSVFRNTKYDVLYLNSFFSPNFTIKPLLLRRLRLIPQKPVLVAPRGEFSAGALKLKQLKKLAYLMLAKATGLYNGVVWQASSRYEEKAIRRWFGARVPIKIAPDLAAPLCEQEPRRREKVAGRLKAAFLSRVSRMKNLDGALEMLGGVRGEVRLDIYGPIEDRKYWEKCQRLIDKLPQNVHVKYGGEVAPDEVINVLSKYDLFFLPTLGENFGHVVLEALLAGCPVLISDQTPWRNLQDRGVGWDLPLNRPGEFQSVLQRFVEMDNDVHQTHSKHARAFGVSQARDQTLVEKSRDLFNFALQRVNDDNVAEAP